MNVIRSFVQTKSCQDKNCGNLPTCTQTCAIGYLGDVVLGLNAYQFSSSFRRSERQTAQFECRTFPSDLSMEWMFPYLQFCQHSWTNVSDKYPMNHVMRVAISISYLFRYWLSVLLVELSIFNVICTVSFTV